MLQWFKAIKSLLFITVLFLLLPTENTYVGWRIFEKAGGDFIMATPNNSDRRENVQCDVIGL